MLTLSTSHPWALVTLMVHIHTCGQNIHTYKMNLKKLKKNAAGFVGSTWKVSLHPAPSYSNWKKITGFGGGVVSMVTSWLWCFCPQNSIYNWILHKSEKGGRENASQCSPKSKPVLKPEPKTSDSLQKLQTDQRVAGPGQQISSLYKETKASKTRIWYPSYRNKEDSLTFPLGQSWHKPLRSASSPWVIDQSDPEKHCTLCFFQLILTFTWNAQQSLPISLQLGGYSVSLPFNSKGFSIVQETKSWCWKVQPFGHIKRWLAGGWACL